MKRKFLSIAMACLCVVTSIPVMNVHAAETSVTETVTIEDDDFTDSQSKEEDCTVTVDIGSEFTVTIPKKIFLAGENGEGSYDVTAKGNIAALETINVIPENSFLLSSEGKDDVEAVVAQNQTAFTYADVMQVVENVLVGKTTTGNVSADNLSSGNWKGSFYFNINTVKVSRIGVTAIDGNQTDLNASAYTIEGTEKDALLEKLISSGITDTVTSADDVDALIEVESDDFDNIAKTTFDVSNITEDGDKVVILHYNEETSEWEYIGTYEVEDGEVTTDFTSFSPVAFVVVKEDGTLHSHSYTSSVTTAATCTTEGVKTYTCDCGDSYTESISVIEHTYVDGFCACGAEVEYTNFTLTSSNYSQAGITRSGAVVIPETFEYDGVYYKVTSIGQSAFANCTKLTSITIPDSVTSIGKQAFYNCTKLTNIDIPDNVTSIGEKAFSSCSSLTSITIPDSVTSIGSSVFSRCTSLTSITIPDSVTSIGNQAFSGCKGLTSVTIPDSVTSIGQSAFSSCSSLTSITIPDSVTSIGSEAFSCIANVNYSGTASVNKSSYTGNYWGAKVMNGYIEGDFVYTDSTKTTLGAYIGSDSVVTIPDSITAIGDHAFYCCSVTSITIPDSVTSIGHYAFSYTSLTSVTLPDNLVSIGHSALINCFNLTSVTWKGVEYTDSSEFEDAIISAGVSPSNCTVWGVEA